ncbi:RES family NAD+ phosphorylase [Mesorhizobium sp. B2-5-9]|uniref:RES family NAD+ phosphorylase n=1 Tax=Mesorhizobium sp. B2-5-9 TaxID=2589921 RepID=UPI0015E362F7|nr:RES family NAD+ phosphorylase [Mesorhizobium sp. B2-5-9]
MVDKLAELTPRRFEGEVWRATRLNQDPIAFSYNGGRWAPPSSYQSVPVLYTSMERQGAIAEVSSWLSMLVPRPTKPIVVHRLLIRATDVVTLDARALTGLGVDFERFTERSYAAMGEEPPSRTQEIGAALSFLGIDGVIVPSARWRGSNLILFDNFDNQIEIDDQGSEQVDWLRFLDP